MAVLLNPVRLGTTQNIDISQPLSIGNDKIDGVIISAGMRILVKAQTVQTQNGIYVVQSSGMLSRATDFANGASIDCGTAVFIQEGVLLENTGWVVNLVADSSATSFTVGANAIYFERFTVNLNLSSADVSSAIVLRSVKGYPLTIAELDNNFKWLATSLDQKLNISDFNPTTITEKINSITAEAASLDAWELRGLPPTIDVKEYQTVPIRDETGTIYSAKFNGDLIGNALTADLADYATLANNVDGVVAIINGGTSATTPEGARAALGAVGVDGNEAMVGALKLAPSTTSKVSLKIVPGANEPSSTLPTSLENGDVWANNEYIRYYLNGKKQSIAHIDSPAFTGTPTAPTPAKTNNNTGIATTQFVQYHVTDINAALSLKAPINSPTFTGTVQAPTVSSVSDSSDKIATTKFIANKLAAFDDDYYTKLEIDDKVTTLNTTISNGDKTLQNQINDLNQKIGIPIGTVTYFAANSVPLGYLKCDGTAISKDVYSALFNVIGYTYGGSGNLFRVPDLRGEFIRGFDDGRGVDAGRAFGSWQKGTLTIFDPNYGSYNVATPIARINYTGATNRSTWSDPDGATKELGADHIVNAPETWPNMLRAEVNNLNTPQELATHGWGYAMTRPRNVALMPCIKAFGSVDDPAQINAATALASINAKVNRSGDTMTGYLTLVADPTIDLHAATKKYVDDAKSAAQTYASSLVSAISNYDVFSTGEKSPSPTSFAEKTIRGFSAYNSTDFPGYYFGGITVTGANKVYSGQLAFNWNSEEEAPTGLYFRVNDDTGNTSEWSKWRQVATNTYVDNEISSLSTSATNSLSTKLDKSGGTLTGALTLSGAPTSNLHAATKKYVDDSIASIGFVYTKSEIDAKVFTINYDRANGDINLQSQINALKAADTDLSTAITTAAGARVLRSGDTMTGHLALVGAPTSNLHAATKKYVDDSISGIGSVYTKTEIDAKVFTINYDRANGDTSLQNQIDDLKNNTGIPVGSILYFAANSIPSGFLKCNGASLSKNSYPQLFGVIGYTYGGSGSYFNVPDLRGEFVRGVDDGRGVDSGRTIGSWQKGSVAGYDEENDAVYNISSTEDSVNSYIQLGLDKFEKSLYSTARLTGASKGSIIDLSSNSDSQGWAGITRPRNVALMPCIKAFGTVDDPDQINAHSVIASINEKVTRSGDTMTGYLTLVGNPILAMHAATKQYVDSISLTPGPKGDAGPKGDRGPAGPAGTSYTFTYGSNYTVDYTDIVWRFSDRNYFDVFPPSGKTMWNLLAFIPSIQLIYFAGDVNRDDAIRCEYNKLTDRIRVYVQNTEQRSTPAANWLAIWS